MVSQKLPLVPAVSQFDGSDFAKGNCTMACGVRLLRYATGAIATPGQLRDCQDDKDQDGVKGTSLADMVTALNRCHNFKPSWAAGLDGQNPAGREGASIPWTKVDQLLDEGHMIVLQLKYMKLPRTFREQDPHVENHALTIDARDPAKGYWVVDTIPKRKTYKGRFVPAEHIKAAAFAFARQDRACAAWAKPPEATAIHPAIHRQEGTDMIGFTPTGSPIGTATVNGDGHFAFDLARSKEGAVKLGRGQKLPVIVAGRLSEPINKPELGEARQLVFAVEVAGKRLFVLQGDVTFEPAPASMADFNSGVDALAAALGSAAEAAQRAARKG